MVTTCLPNAPATGICLPEGRWARSVALELNEHHAEQV